MDVKDELKSLKEVVNLLNQYIATPEIQELKSKNVHEFESYLESIFPVFAESYPYLFRVILKGNTKLDFLDTMLNAIIEMSSGKQTQEEVEKKLGEQLADKFIPQHLRRQ